MKKRSSTQEHASRRARRAGPTVHGRAKFTTSDDEDWELTPAQLRSLRLRLKDARDPARFLIVSRFGPRFVLYYNVSDDVYVMNDARGATLFKRLRAALVVRRLLGPRVQVIRCSSRLQKGARVPVLPPKARASRGRPR